MIRKDEPMIESSSLALTVNYVTILVVLWGLLLRKYT